MLNEMIVNGNNNNIAGRDVNVRQYIVSSHYFHPIKTIVPGYIHLGYEKDVIRHVNEHCVTVLHAITGMGKTLMAQAVGLTLQNKYSPFLLDATELSLETIKNAVLDINDGKNILLVVDNMSNNVEAFAEWFEAMYDKRQKNISKVIITTQYSKYVEERFLLPLSVPSYDEAQKILLNKVDKSKLSRITDVQIKKFVNEVSGLPLVLKLVNFLIRSDEVTLLDFIKDSSLAITINDESSEERIVDRLLRNFMGCHKSSIALLKWLGIAYGDRYFLRKFIGTAELLFLKNSGIFVSVGYPNKNSVKMHDVIYKAVMTYDLSELNNVEEKFWQCLLNEGESDDYVNAIFCYKKKIQELCTGTLKWNYKTYVYIRISTDSELLIANLNQRLAVPDVNEIGMMCKNDRLCAYRCIIEFRERWQHLIDGHDEKKVFVSETCNIYTDLIAYEIEEDLRLQLGHHLGKAYFWLGDIEAAISNFMAVLDCNPNSYETMLQMARCYRRLKDYKAASSMIKGILDAGYNSDGVVQISVLLAALNELKYDENSSLREKFVIANWEKFKEIILSASNFDYDQPFETFVGVGRKISYEHPELYEELAEKIPIKISLEGKSDKLLFNVAEFCVARYLHGKENGHKDSGLLEKAEAYYAKAKHLNDYQLTRYSIVFLEKKAFDKALRILNQINKFEKFAYYRRAQAYYGLENIDKAEADIDACITEAMCRPDHYLSAFYVLKGEIVQKKDGISKEWFEKALKYCDSEKYRLVIEEKISAAS